MNLQQRLTAKELRLGAALPSTVLCCRISKCFRSIRGVRFLMPLAFHPETEIKNQAWKLLRSRGFEPSQGQEGDLRLLNAGGFPRLDSCNLWGCLLSFPKGLSSLSASRAASKPSEMELKWMLRSLGLATVRVFIGAHTQMIRTHLVTAGQLMLRRRKWLA